MSQSLVKIYVHIIFSTKDRRDSIPKVLLPELHSYIAGIMRRNDIRLVIVGGTVNHVHILCELSGIMTVSELVRIVKSNSSKWMNEQPNVMGVFAWQSGYAALSVSQSGVDAVTSYISSQEEHHKNRDFKEELLLFLEKYKVGYDERYLWL